jgi:hypothetical protein
MFPYYSMFPVCDRFHYNLMRITFFSLFTFDSYGLENFFGFPCSIRMLLGRFVFVSQTTRRFNVIF